MDVQLMIEKVKSHEVGMDDGHLLLQLYTMARKMTVLAVGGAMCGMIAGVVTTVRSRIDFRLADAVFRFMASSARSTPAPCIATQYRIVQLQTLRQLQGEQG